MGGVEAHDYPSLLKQALELVKSRKVKSLADVARELGVNYNTFVTGFERHFDIRKFEDLVNKQDYVGGYPDCGYFLNRNVYITHGDLVRSAPGATASEVSRRQAFTTIFGHIHRRELVARRMKTSDGDLIYSAFCPGAACHIDGRVPGSKSDQQWQQGFAVVEYTDDEEHIIPIAVQDGTMMYNGKVWTARKVDAEIEKVIDDGLAQVTA